MNGDQCWCGDINDSGNIANPANQAAEADCNLACPGQLGGVACGSADVCGASDKINVYYSCKEPVSTKYLEVQRIVVFLDTQFL